MYVQVWIKLYLSLHVDALCKCICLIYCMDIFNHLQLSILASGSKCNLICVYLIVFLCTCKKIMYTAQIFIDHAICVVFRYALFLVRPNVLIQIQPTHRLTRAFLFLNLSSALAVTPSTTLVFIVFQFIPNTSVCRARGLSTHTVYALKPTKFSTYEHIIAVEGTYPYDIVHFLIVLFTLIFLKVCQEKRVAEVLNIIDFTVLFCNIFVLQMLNDMIMQN